MEILDVAQGNFVRLSPVEYQFPVPLGNPYDDNWLVVSGHVRIGGEEWTFQDPFLLVWEAEHLGEWLEAASAGRVTPVEPDADGSTFPDTETLEPVVGFALVSHDATTVVLRVFLWLEAAPPSFEEARPNMDYFFDIATTPDALRATVREWNEELTRFPHRKFSA